MSTFVGVLVVLIIGYAFGRYRRDQWSRGQFVRMCNEKQSLKEELAGYKADWAFLERQKALQAIDDGLEVRVGGDESGRGYIVVNGKREKL